jgi:hypothetical protein
MKKSTILITITIALLLTSCYTYKTFIAVENSVDVPNGSKEILFKGNVQDFLTVLTNENILYTKLENGYETSEILLDEGTRAKYRIFQQNDSIVKIIPFWGYTAKVNSQIAGMQQALVGYSTVNGYDANEWTRVLYKKNEARPKSVFDYGIQLAKKITGDIKYQ